MPSNSCNPMIGRLRFAGSGLFSSRPPCFLVQTIVPHKALPHESIRMIASLSSTIQSPLGVAANAGLAIRTSNNPQRNFPIGTFAHPCKLAGRKLAVRFQHLAATLGQLRSIADQTTDESVLVVALNF